MKRGYIDQKLFEMFPKHIDYIKAYREFLYEQSKPCCPNEKENFIEEVFELAFGDNAINRGFTFSDVLSALKKDSDTIGEIHSLLDQRI